jgi:RNA polymerase sigma factor (sigma-70 family)
VIHDEPVLDVGPAPTSAGFDAVYQRERQPMLRLAYLLVGSTEAAEDLVHDAFIELYQRWETVDAPGAYVRRAVVNRSMSWHRRDRVARAWLDRHAGDQRLAELHGEPHEPLWDLVLQLSPPQRTAVVLTYYLDLTSEAAAEQMGCRPATVRSLVFRGLAALRKEFR